MDRANTVTNGSAAGAPNARSHRARDREGGQVMVEFALILLPLVLLVGGIVQFGIGLNYWLDLNRLANQGARWAVVDNFPGCPRGGATLCVNPTLQQYIACQPVAKALEPTVLISFPETQVGPVKSDRGDAVRVEVSTDFELLPVLGIGTITLQGRADMRIEQDASRYGPGTNAPWACAP